MCPPPLLSSICCQSVTRRVQGVYAGASGETESRGRCSGCRRSCDGKEEMKSRCVLVIYQYTCWHVCKPASHWLLFWHFLLIKCSWFASRYSEGFASLITDSVLSISPSFSALPPPLSPLFHFSSSLPPTTFFRHLSHFQHLCLSLVINPGFL